MHKAGKIDVLDAPRRPLPPAVGEVGIDAAWFLSRVEELREEYLGQLEERCAGSGYPDYEARALLTGWFAELRAECETRLARLEAAVAGLLRQRSRH